MAKAATTPAVKARATWKHAHVPLRIHTAFQEMGKEKGYFAEQGIDIEFSIVQDGNTATKAVIAGELDSSGSSPAAVMIAISQGAPVKLVGTVQDKQTTYLFARKEIRSLQDLYERNVGVGTVGAYLHQVSTAVLKRKGLDPDKVRWVSIDSSTDVWGALVAQKIDAGASSIDFIQELPKYPDLHILASFAEELPNFLNDAFPVTDKTLAERKDVAIRAMTAMVKGVRHAIEHKDEFVALAKKLTKRDDETCAFIHDAYLKSRLVEGNFRLNPDAIAYTQQISVESGQMKEVLPYPKVATDDIANAVLANLGPWSYK